MKKYYIIAIVVILLSILLGIFVFGDIFKKPTTIEEKDIFFHSNELKNVEFNDLKEGDKVTFEVEEGPKGLNATNVNKV